MTPNLYFTFEFWFGLWDDDHPFESTVCNRRHVENSFIKIVKLWQNINFITMENKGTQLKWFAWKSSKFEIFNALFAAVGSPHIQAMFLRNRIEPYSTLPLQNFQQPNSITQNNNDLFEQNFTFYEPMTTATCLQFYECARPIQLHSTCNKNYERSVSFSLLYERSSKIC